MSKLSEIIEEGKRHEVALLNQQGNRLVKLPLIWAAIIAIAAPQLVLVLLFATLLEIVDLEYNGRRIRPESGEPK